MLPNIAISDQLYGKEQPLAFKVCVNQKASLISGNDVSVKWIMSTQFMGKQPLRSSLDPLERINFEKRIKWKSRNVITNPETRSKGYLINAFSVISKILNRVRMFWLDLLSDISHTSCKVFWWENYHLT